MVAFGIREINDFVPDPLYFVPSKVHVMGMAAMLHVQDVDLKYLRQQRMEGLILAIKKRDFFQQWRKDRLYSYEYEEAGDW